MSITCLDILNVVCGFHWHIFFRAATRSDMMTPLNRSVARVAKPGERLFLVSDILHNAGTANVPGASSFRGRQK